MGFPTTPVRTFAGLVALGILSYSLLTGYNVTINFERRGSNDSKKEPAEPSQKSKKSKSASSSRQDDAEDPDVYKFRTVAVLYSVFPNKRGVPRQGKLAPATIGRIVFRKHIAPPALEGLDEYSHVWIFFIFSRNTNSKVVTRWVEQNGSFTFPPRVKAPLLLGRSTGLFSTRSPHRPNPIGLTLAKLVSVDMKKREIVVSGIDICDATPVLDIKPYNPADIVEDPRFASWIDVEAFSDKSKNDYDFPLKVKLTASAKNDLKRCARTLKFYENENAALAAIEQVLRLDIRGVYQGRGGASTKVHHCVVDTLRVEFTVFPLQNILVATIEKIYLCTDRDRLPARYIPNDQS